MMPLSWPEILFWSRNSWPLHMPRHKVQLFLGAAVHPSLCRFLDSVILLPNSIGLSRMACRNILDRSSVPMSSFFFQMPATKISEPFWKVLDAWLGQALLDKQHLLVFFFVHEVDHSGSRFLWESTSYFHVLQVCFLCSQTATPLVHSSASSSCLFTGASLAVFLAAFLWNGNVISLKT